MAWPLVELLDALVDAIRSRRIYPEEIERRPHAFLMSARTSLLHELGRVVDGAVGIWSMWRGYLERSPDLVADLRARGVTLHRVHASGHASRGDLASFAAAVSAGVVVPVHTRNPRAFVGAVANVRLHDDGDWWSV